MKHFITKFSSTLLALLLLVGAAEAQFTAEGTVTDEGGTPLIGVSVAVKNTTLGTVTNIDGRFALEVPGDETTLSVSYVGYIFQEVAVSASSPNADIVLKEDVANLEEVVITGLASSVKRSNLANAVSTVSAKELTGVTSQQTLDGALYGKLTGVNLNASSGAPGGGIAMRLRGVSSLSGNNQPLFIVDGVYVSNAEIPSGLRNASGANSGSEENASNRIADISPDDIESIEVLKGPSAAAIYGTRANAGVVLITTKKGKAGQTKVSFDQDLGVNVIQKYAGRRDYTAQTVEQTFGAAEAALFTAAQAAGEIFDYEREIYGETGFITDSRLSISGGNNKTSFFFGGGFRDEDGIIKNTGYRKASLRLNLEHKISKFIKISTTTNYVNSISNRSFTGNENEGGLSYGYTLAFTRDWINLFPDEDGVYPDNPNYTGNPLFVRDNAINEETVHRVIQGARVDINLIQNDNMVLKVAANGGIDFFFLNTSVYVPENHQAQRGNDNGYIGVGRNTVTNYNYQAFAVWDNYLNNSGISLSTQAGISYLNFDRNFVFNQTTQLIPLQNNLTQGNAQAITQTLENEEEFGIIFQQDINWEDKIILSGGVRFDKSNLNGDQNKFYAFPKAAVAINVGNFIEDSPFDLLKLRAAYGQTGNSPEFGALFTALTPNAVGGNSGFLIDPQLGDANLEPERASEIEFGVDLAILDNKLGLEASYYIKSVSDLIYERSIPSSSGFSREFRNDLDLVNRGVELALNANPVSTRNLKWNTTVNWWFNRSEVTSLGVPSFVPAGTAFGLGLGTFFIEEGQPITQLKGNGDEGPITVGDVEPDFQMGWFNTFTIAKNLDVSFLFHWKQGGDVLNLSRLLTDLGGVTEDLDSPEEIANPRLSQNFALAYVEDATYLRLREAAIYYNIPMKSDVVQGVRVGVSARNALTFTGYSSYDPEVSTKGTTGLSQGVEVTPFPSARQFYFHLAVDF